jgi:hypothetical protein
MMSLGTSHTSGLVLQSGADGRNQVIAACGNGSLRLFDVTLEVGGLQPSA